MKRLVTGILFVAVILTITTACKPTAESSNPAQETANRKEAGELMRVGTFVVYQSDLDYHLQERFGGRSDEGTRKKALDELAARARFAQAALDSDLDRNPVVRAEVARILSNQLKEADLNPQLKDVGRGIDESRLREIYGLQTNRFASNEKRHIAVLWLNPGSDPARAKRYQEKLRKAREWFFDSSDLKDRPDEGFSVLAVDHSEHSASRYKGGALGWLEREGGSTDWSRAVAEIGFSLDGTGDVSSVITRPEGIFLVRLMGVKPAVQMTFESVRSVIEREEVRNRRQQIEAEFYQELENRYPEH